MAPGCKPTLERFAMSENATYNRISVEDVLLSCGIQLFRVEVGNRAPVQRPLIVREFIVTKLPMMNRSILIERPASSRSCCFVRVGEDL